MRLDPPVDNLYLVNRRTLVRLATGAVYSAPLVSASIHLGDFSARAEDDEQISAPSNDVVPPENDKPQAIVGEGFEVVDEDDDGFALVTVDGSGSLDADGPIASYVWTLKGDVVAESATATVSLPVGTHRLVLTVKDENGESGDAKLRIRVKRYEEPTAAEPTEAPVAPAPPYDVQVKQEKAEVVITWRERDGTPKPIRIYRVVDDLLVTPIEERKWELLFEEWEKLEYRDLTAIPDEPYLYVLRSFDGVLESDWSNMVAFTATQYVEEEGEEVVEEPPATTAPEIEPTEVVEEPTTEPPPEPTEVVEEPSEEEPDESSESSDAEQESESESEG